jgi:hypothetical protein
LQFQIHKDHVRANSRAPCTPVKYFDPGLSAWLCSTLSVDAVFRVKPAVNLCLGMLFGDRRSKSTWPLSLFQRHLCE